MKRIKIHSLLLISFAMLLLGGGPLSAQGSDPIGEVTATWTAHSGFSDATLQIWYSVFLAEEGNAQDGGVYKNTQALSTKFTSLTVGSVYIYSVTVLGCTSSEAANIEADTRNPSCSEGAPGYADARVTASPSGEICAKAYSGPGYTGEISFSWAAHAADTQNPGAAIWYCVAGAYESIATTDTSATLQGLTTDSEYRWTVDAFSCVGDETMAAGTCTKLTPNRSHASGTATATAIVNGEATFTWDAHSFTDTSLQVWYWVGIQHPDTTIDWMKTQETSVTWPSLAAGFEYSILLDAYGCTAEEVSGFSDGDAPNCGEFVQLDDATWKVTATLIGGSSSGGTSDGDSSDDGDGSEIMGELSLSWDAHSFSDTSLQVWYWVTLRLPDSTQAYKKTQATSVTFTGLTVGEEYPYLLDAYGCTENEVSGFTEGNAPNCAEFMQLDDNTWTGTAVRSSGRRQQSSGSSSRSSSSSSSSAALPSAPSAPAAAIIDHSVTVSGSANYQPVTGAGIGNAAVLAQGVVAATDVWGYVPAGTRVCFIARSGSGVAFLDANTAPRALSWLNASIIGADTCVQIPGAGTVVLVGPAAAPPAPAPVQAQPSTAAVAAGAPPPPGESPSNSLCLIKLTDTLFLRLAPGGEIIGLVWLNSEVPVYEIVGEWYLVEFEGQLGYISRHSRQVLQGSC